ncbi:hypothetical protein ACFL0Q_05270, partial [Thermodesulfobacteriota bacterium]
LSVYDFHREGSFTSGIQEAVNALPPEGGIVSIPVGTYQLGRSITLRSSVKLKGQGELTVITRRDPYVEVWLTQPARKTEQIVVVEDSSGFMVGTEVMVSNSKTPWNQKTHAIIDFIEGNRVGLDRGLRGDCLPQSGAMMVNSFPAIRASAGANIRVEDLLIDGRMGDADKDQSTDSRCECLLKRHNILRKSAGRVIDIMIRSIL